MFTWFSHCKPFPLLWPHFRVPFQHGREGGGAGLLHCNWAFTTPACEGLDSEQEEGFVPWQHHHSDRSEVCGPNSWKGILHKWWQLLAGAGACICMSIGPENLGTSVAQISCLDCKPQSEVGEGEAMPWEAAEQVRWQKAGAVGRALILAN